MKTFLKTLPLWALAAVLLYGTGAAVTVIRRLNDLADVRLPATISAPNTNLVWNGTAWTNGPSSGGGGFTGNANQFNSSGGKTNISQYAPVTNLQAAVGSYASPAYGFNFAGETNSGLLMPEVDKLSLSISAGRSALFAPTRTTLGTNNFLDFILSGSTNTTSQIIFQGDNELVRWSQARFGAETGSNAGSDFQIWAYDDAGAYVDTPFQVVRAAGGAITAARPFLMSNGSTNAGTAVFLSTVTLSNLNAVLGTDGTGKIVATNASGATALSAITAATGANVITNLDYNQTWKWCMANASTGLKLSEHAAGTGHGWLLYIDTLPDSLVHGFANDVRGFNVMYASSYTNQWLFNTNGPSYPVIASQFSTNTGISFNGDSMVISAGAGGNIVATFTNAALIATNYLSPWATELTYTGGTNVVIPPTANAFHLLVTNTTHISLSSVPSRLWTAWVEIEQASPGGFAVTFTNTFDFSGQTAPTITTNSGKMDNLEIKSNSRGTNVSAWVSQNHQP
mgnify:CR=1 FL=1